MGTAHLEHSQWHNGWIFMLQSPKRYTNFLLLLWNRDSFNTMASILTVLQPKIQRVKTSQDEISYLKSWNLFSKFDLYVPISASSKVSGVDFTTEIAPALCKALTASSATMESKLKVRLKQREK